MNESDSCDSLINKVNWTDAISVLVLVVLLLINVMVVLGNCLVIAAVFISSKLRTVTNLFIVSLAVADLMVGVAVLPFSATWEVFKVWIFGDLWCSIWLAVDVWMCTASILNLCAISLDRYVAVTRPVNYPSIMSSSRAKILIAGVWILSFVICFPPLVGWKGQKLINGTTDAIGFRIRHPHPMVLNQRPFATSTSEFVVVDKTTPSLPKNLTENQQKVNESDEYETNAFEFEKEEDDYYSYPEEYREFPWIIPMSFAERKKKSANGGLNKMASFSGIPVVSPNIFRYPNTQENKFTQISEPTLTIVESPPDSIECPWICELTSDTGYVIYSALGSFFIPMAVMLFFYWKIYRAAVQTTRAINQGFRTTKGSGGFGNRFDEQRLTLRIHRGKGSVQNHSSASSTITTCGSVSGSPSGNSSCGKSPETQRLTRTQSTKSGKSHDKIKIKVSYPSSEQISTSSLNNNGIPLSNSPDSSSYTPADKLLDPPKDGKNYLTINSLRASPKKTSLISSTPKKNFFQNHFASKKCSGSKEVSYSVHYTIKNGKEPTTTTNVYKNQDPNSYLRVTEARLAAAQNSKSGRSHSMDSTNSGYDEDSMSRRNSTRSGCVDEVVSKELTPSPTFDDNNSQKPKFITKMGKRNIKTQVKRFRMETKAAKTLGIIVGGFILCWMPFFTIYLIRPFCPECINPIVFSVLFWLGYCNSAINPCIYALFSKDFRFAFKKIICRFLCGSESKLSIHASRRGSDGSQMTQKDQRNQRSPSYIPPNSVGEDSDPVGSDSR